MFGLVLMLILAAVLLPRLLKGALGSGFKLDLSGAMGTGTDLFAELAGGALGTLPPDYQTAKDTVAAANEAVKAKAPVVAPKYLNQLMVASASLLVEPTFYDAALNVLSIVQPVAGLAYQAWDAYSTGNELDERGKKLRIAIINCCDDYRKKKGWTVEQCIAAPDAFKKAFQKDNYHYCTSKFGVRRVKKSDGSMWFVSGLGSTVLPILQEVDVVTWPEYISLLQGENYPMTQYL